MLNPKEIGRRIAGIRELKEMTLEEIASQVQVSRSTILRYERGDFERIKLPILISIANALGVSPEYLSGQTDDYGLSEALEDHRNSQDEYSNNSPELTSYLEELRTRPEMRMLFSVAKNAAKEDIEKAVAIIEALRKTEGR